MNHQPKTAINDPALQLAVSSVLQSWGSENDVFLQSSQGLQTANDVLDLQ